MIRPSAIVDGRAAIDSKLERKLVNRQPMHNIAIGDMLERWTPATVCLIDTYAICQRAVTRRCAKDRA